MVIPVLLVLIVLVVGGLYFTGNLPTFSVLGEPVFCDDYEWVCCGEKEQTKSLVNFSSYKPSISSQPWQCDGVNCKFIGGAVIVCKDGVKRADFFGFNLDQWACTQSIRTTQVSKGEYVIGNASGSSSDWGSVSLSNTTNYYIKTVQRLAWCGDAACDAGTTGIGIIEGSCSYAFDGVVFESATQGDLAIPGAAQICFPFIGCFANPLAGAYTVPVGECYLAKSSRHVCGYTEEKCSVDSECRDGHKYIYNGYGAECHTGQLDLYGCQKDVCLAEAPDGTCLFGRQSFCTTFKSINVECCPGAGSCGIGMACDSTTFQCEPVQQVECYDDFDCSGWQSRCDPNTLSIGGNKCINNSCQWVVSQNVECCYSSDCATGYYCQQGTNKCVLAAEERLSCPFECCENEIDFFDKPAPSGMVCCPDNTVKNSLDLCEGNGDEDNGIEDKAKCEAKEGDGLFVVGYKWVETNTPATLFGFIPWIGTTTTTSCDPVYNLTLIGLGVIALIAFAVYMKFRGVKKR